ncbi:hypothetical protein [Nocardioides hwasunensis]|uniref:DUF2142 domain-containing protein n=1 Tax=Nocardioides hwasunensis TaxID=397258 RepID=A0ABR8MAY3_9ACTN|nr:hypothetical protein [Nocardioides hwasunensis]MBD3913112.1 hypothetical protein [Nocardioides hwasunensis]
MNGVADAGASSGPKPAWWRRRGDLLAVLALIVASFVFTTDQVNEHEMLSPIDEYQYIGYYANVADHGIVRRGEAMPFFARKYVVCHGVRNIPEMQVNPAACRKPNSVGYPIEGGTTADLYTPLYFGVTRVLAQPLIWAGVDFVSAGRMVGGAWLALGAVLLYLAMRRRNVPIPVAVGLNLVMVGSLAAYWGNTYISTDATALAAGGLAALLAMQALDGRRRALVLLPLAGALATLFKLQNLIGFGAAALVLMLTAAYEASQRPDGPASRLRGFVVDRRTVSALATIVVSVVAQGCWIALRSALAVGEQPKFGFGEPLKGSNLVVELGNFLPSMGGGALAPYATGVTSLPVYMVATALAIGGCVGLALSGGTAPVRRIVGASTVLVAVLAAPALAIVVGFVENNYVPLPSRYAHSLLPWALLSAALLIDRPRPWLRYVLLALGVVTWGLALMMGEA